MEYPDVKIDHKALLKPVAEATALLARLDARIAASPAGEGWLRRVDYLDACASLWVDGELVQMEDLVLHDASADLQHPTHELTIAHDVMRMRRRIFRSEPGRALAVDGLDFARREGEEFAPPPENETQNAYDDFDRHLAAFDAVLEHSDAAIDKRERNRIDAQQDYPLYDPDFDADERHGRWLGYIEGLSDLPDVLRAALAMDGWSTIGVVERAGWTGRLLSAELIRAGGTTPSLLPPLNLGLKQIGFERRRSRSAATRILASLEAFRVAAEESLKLLDRLELTRQRFERITRNVPANSRLPSLSDLLLERPVVSCASMARDLQITPQGAAKLIAKLPVRELTGRRRFRIWGVV